MPIYYVPVEGGERVEWPEDRPIPSAEDLANVDVVERGSFGWRINWDGPDADPEPEPQSGITLHAIVELDDNDEVVARWDAENQWTEGTAFGGAESDDEECDP